MEPSDRDDELERLHAELRELRAENERLVAEAHEVAVANVHAATQIAAMAERQRDEALERERELEAALAAAEAAATQKRDFLTKVSHELRTPLNGILGLSEILTSAELDEEHRAIARSVSAAADSLSTLIDDLLDTSALEVGHLELNEDSFDLWESLEEVARLHASGLGRDDVPLVLEIEPDVPRRVVGDSHRLRQVISNLLDNALRFTDSGRVAMHAALVSDRVRFRVVDTGCGIAPEVLPRLFEPFRQVEDSIRRSNGGMGLGLAISSSLVELMGGTIGATSEPGVGTTVSFELPLRVDAHCPSPILYDGSLLACSSEPLVRRALSNIVDQTADSPQVTTFDSIPGLIQHLIASGAPSGTVLVIDAGWTPTDTLESGVSLALNHLPSDGRLALLTPLTRDLQLEHVHDPRVTPLRTPVPWSRVIDWLTRTNRQGELPAVDEIAAPLPASTRRSESGAPPSETIGGEILVVDDDPGTVSFLRAILERLGRKVDVARTGPQALERVELRAYDVVLLDLCIPDLDGYDTARAIRSSSSRAAQRVPIVAITGSHETGLAERCLAAGMDGVLQKPLSVREIEGVVLANGGATRSLIR